MATLLHIDASARQSRSLTRQMGIRFVAEWRARRPTDVVIHRDAGARPPPVVSEAWISAAFTPESKRTARQHNLLALSDELIDELDQADILLFAVPMYNYGLPAALKAWIDQVSRVGKTFTFDLARGDFPLEPIMTGKTMVLLTSSGEFGFGPSGARKNMNHLVPYLNTVSPFLGVVETHHVGIEYQEFGDDRHIASVNAAHAAIPELVDKLSSRQIRYAA